MNDAIIATDERWVITAWNRAAEAIFGWEAEEVLGRALEEVLPTELTPEAHRSLAETGQVRVEATYHRKDGEPVHTEADIVALRDKDGHIAGHVSVILDIDQRKQAEQALREHREDLNRAQAVAQTGSWRLDVQHNELLWSDETHRMFGIPKETPLTYETFLANVHPEDREYVDQAWTAAMRGQPYDIEHRIVVGDTVRWVHERAELEFDENGTLRGGFGTVQDVTERKQAEEAIEQERQRLRVLVDTSPVGIVVVDADGRLLLVNREAERILDTSFANGDSLESYERAAVRRRPDGSLYTREELPLERALRRGETVRAEEIWFHLPDGRVVPTLRNTTPLYGTSGEIVGAIAIIQDMTPLEEVERVRSEFLGMVTHELKTPLTAIKGSAATALGSSRPLDAAQVRELFEIINGQADRLRELVDDLLDMTRIEAGSLSINPEPVHLRGVIEEALATFVRSAGLRDVRLELPDGLPPVKADRGRIGQVMTNLLTNAAKFSPSEAPITISAEQDCLSVTIHVRDEGRGIAREKLPLLFKKFSRLHEDSAHKLSSTGLGLAICKGIIEAHGGRIWADSGGEGKGTTFSFSLPVAVQEAGAKVAGIGPEAVQARKVTRRSERTRVLAVDDEPHILRYLQRSLSDAGYQAIVTGDPSRVTRLVELEEPDLVVLDLRLPGTSGFDLLQRIRELSPVPVIFLTASDREEDAVQALRMGADDYITKPFSPSELLARIEAVLRRRATTGPTEARRSLMLEDLTINFAEREVTLAGQPVSLSATEYKLLYELATHAGRVLTYDQILQRVWGPEYSGETELVRSFVRNLRRKLGEDARNPRFILTERQVGYRMPKPQG
jgi:PAS domain S-box-containing protein